MCVGRCNRLFLCSYGGETRDYSSSSPVRAKERCGLEREVWPGEAVTRRGRAFCRQSPREARKGSERNKRDLVKTVECVEMFALEACL